MYNRLRVGYRENYHLSFFIGYNTTQLPLNRTKLIGVIRQILKLNFQFVHECDVKVVVSRGAILTYMMK
jgi:hypothetical protein